jgi:hypothetical protein
MTKFNKDDEAMICWARISSGILKMQRKMCWHDSVEVMLGVSGCTGILMR